MATTLRGGRGRLRLQGLQLRDQLVRHDLLHLLNGRLEQFRRLHLLRVEPLSLGVRADGVRPGGGRERRVSNRRLAGIVRAKTVTPGAEVRQQGKQDDDESDG